MENSQEVTQKHFTEDVIIKAKKGMPILLLNLILFFGSIALFINSILSASFLMIGLSVVLFISSIIAFCGLKIVKPNEARVFTFFGEYKGVIKESGYYYVNPFMSSVTEKEAKSEEEMMASQNNQAKTGVKETPYKETNRISMKTRTLLNNKQKINDELGNPIEIGIAVTWKIDCVSMALFNVDDYKKYLSVQCDAVLRDIVRSYPYDLSNSENGGDEKTLRGSSAEISQKMEEAIQEKVRIAGLQIIDARITHLAYAPEIAAAMLQRQQASAVVDARQLIVEGAVGMVDMALKKLSEDQIVELDDERKAQMVSNLMVVLCGNKEAQPVVNSGSIY